MQKQNRTRAAVLTVAVGTFMSALDSSVVNVVLPVIQSSYGVSLSAAGWVVIAYLLVISSLLLTFGRLSDLYGHRRIYIAGFAVFTAGSLLCGLSASILMLIAFRVLQALGAGMMFSAGPAIITDAVPENVRGRALSVTAVAVAVALCSGPVLGGILAELAGWQSIFFINVPIGLVGTFLAARNIPKDDKKVSGRFDILGSVMIFAALILILTPLDLLGKENLNPVLFYGMLAAGILAGIGFVFYEKKVEQPILNIALFKSRVFAAGNFAAVFNFMAQNIMIFLAPFYLERLRLFSPATAGMLYMPMPLATLLIAPVSGIASDRYDSRYLCSGGMAVMAGGLVMLSYLKADTPVWYIVTAMALAGLGSGMFQTPNNSAVMGSVPAEYRGTASGVLATMRNTGMVLGVAVSGALFSLNYNRAGLLYGAQGLKAAELQQASFLYALHFTFLTAAGVALLSMLVSLKKGKVRTKL
ncbi:MAG TPA: MFS transporter [Caproiciproducens sp.]|nr:MFS transporter [Caproiciproducens sp.]